ncbi:hypothetical protein TMatcc_001303 [Talaromyces marneffei ATCC 18224]|uniref:Uncharacterized protein n=1 Tax=Talaromyces marneffei (strain ATCC 18224 / CBS 334.59 / QM 7333) TaxID=441960 RepID=B6QJD8_TALMQ|nr:hypothetical protein PMAA_090820 [Talaromyces marneffei ATCC 18224]
MKLTTATYLSLLLLKGSLASPIAIPQPENAIENVPDAIAGTVSAVIAGSTNNAADGALKRDAADGLLKRDAADGLLKRDAADGLLKRDAADGLLKRDAADGLLKRDATELHALA